LFLLIILEVLVHDFGPVVRQHIIVGVGEVAKPFTSHLGSKREEEEGARVPQTLSKAHLQ
jgi:hypothetical protein